MIRVAAGQLGRSAQFRHPRSQAIWVARPTRRVRSIPSSRGHEESGSHGQPGASIQFRHLDVTRNMGRTANLVGYSIPSSRGHEEIWVARPTRRVHSFRHPEVTRNLVARPTRHVHSIPSSRGHEEYWVARPTRRVHSIPSSRGHEEYESHGQPGASTRFRHPEVTRYLGRTANPARLLNSVIPRSQAIWVARPTRRVHSIPSSRGHEESESHGQPGVSTQFRHPEVTSNPGRTANPAGPLNSVIPRSRGMLGRTANLACPLNSVIPRSRGIWVAQANPACPLNSVIPRSRGIGVARPTRRVHSIPSSRGHEVSGSHGQPGGSQRVEVERRVLTSLGVTGARNDRMLGVTGCAE